MGSKSYELGVAAIDTTYSYGVQGAECAEHGLQLQKGIEVTDPECPVVGKDTSYERCPRLISIEAKIAEIERKLLAQTVSIEN